MTTNKPEVVAWIWGYRGRHMATTDYSQALELAEPPYPTEVEPLIRLADYQRLQADHERLQAECEDLRTALAESRANDQQAMAYLSEVRAIVGGDDFPDMVEKCKELRKDAEFGRSVLSKREPGKVYGCHCDLEEGMGPDGCIIDSGERHNCVYAKDISVKEQCEYWRVIASDAAMQGDQL